FETKSKAIELLVGGKVTEAYQMIAEYMITAPRSRRIGIDWVEETKKKAPQRIYDLMLLDYSDLDVSKEIRSHIAAEIALSLITGEGWRKTAKRLIVITGEPFPCPDLAKYAEVNYAEIPLAYIQTKACQATAIANIKTYKAQRNIIKGIQLSPCNSACEFCFKGAGKYTWDEIDQMPTLPRHWGCRCIYIPWTKSWEELGINPNTIRRKVEF
ncbi:hypothetical protein LLG39_18050, partial [bacterium]|nr:hypothetical protein [bacterium]